MRWKVMYQYLGLDSLECWSSAMADTNPYRARKRKQNIIVGVGAAVSLAGGIVLELVVPLNNTATARVAGFFVVFLLFLPFLLWATSGHTDREL